MQFANTISPFEEMVAYETLWGLPNESWKSIAVAFDEHKLRPSEVLSQKRGLFNDKIEELEKQVRLRLKAKKGFSVAVNGDFSYPKKLRDAEHPIELFYYKGDIGLVDGYCVSVVGTRKASTLGRQRAKQIAKLLVENQYTVVSGLATGIDTEALTSAIQCDGHVIAVIGTPIDQYYPAENRELQNLIADKHLLISQVPFYRYETEPFRMRPLYFPQRNITMSALSLATIIIEASDTSGTLTQARACLKQGRKLFILQSCFENKQINWPAKFEKEGAIRVSNSEDIINHLAALRSNPQEQNVKLPPAWNV